jgi:site-specific DNA-cytosine methylase
MAIYENHPNDSRIKGPLPVAPQLTAWDGTGGKLWCDYEEDNCGGPDRASGSKQADTDLVEYAYGGQTAQSVRSKWSKGSGGPSGDECANMVTHRAFVQNTRDEVRYQNGDGAQVGALPAQPGAKQQAYIEMVTHRAFNVSPGSADKGKKDDIHITEANQSKTLDGHDPSCHQGGTIATEGMTVRRLTPMECERLQGFPDHYTKVPYRNKPVDKCPDGPRYKALGNSIAVPVLAWIGDRLEKVHKLCLK